tara:strand:+ start:613 stop:1050 length:438 start_codon:yes stop_codon:yes gene_type:complete
MNTTKSADIKFGLQSENESMDILENYFGKLLKTSDNKDMGKYYEFDFYNNNYYIELKTRKIKHNQYNSLFFGLNKFNKAEKLLKINPDLKIYYLWKCNDGIYLWKHNSTPYEVKIMGRCDRRGDERDYCVDIKQEHIKPISSLVE